METTLVQTLGEYISVIEALHRSDKPTLFRGQNCEGNLLPSIVRIDPEVDTGPVETKMLGELRRTGTMLLNSQGLDDWELLVVAQHYGLSTRLLDWSSNPLAALWFACTGKADGDGFIYGLQSKDEDMIGRGEKSPFKQARTRIYRPRLNNPRIVAQSGWFTVHRYSKKAGAFVPLEKNAEMSKSVFEIRIPVSAKHELLRSLDRNGMNSTVLFPDLEGLCRHLSWKHSPIG